MAINLVHRKDLDDRVERLAACLGLRGRGRKTAVIERALSVLEERVAHSYPDRATIEAALDRYLQAGARLRERVETRSADRPQAPLSLALQEALYDNHGLPR